MPVRKKVTKTKAPDKSKSLESWIWDTGAASRGSGNAGTNKEKTVRQWFVDHDLIESVLYLPENLIPNEGTDKALKAILLQLGY